ncbi:MAG TPA: hypothetical protein VK360_00285 [Acidimicrobiales bacterium]|nr:hypothetical protein [Acidimicrobiales bacterium]
MVFGRRKNRDRDPFAHLAGERVDAESGSPWFLDPDDGPELDVEAGISSNLRDDDVAGEPYDDEPGHPAP